MRLHSGGGLQAQRYFGWFIDPTITAMPGLVTPTLDPEQYGEMMHDRS